MEGKRISQLTPDTSPSTDDFIVSVDGSTMENKRVDLGSLPVSTAQATEIGAKVNKAGDTMTGRLISAAGIAGYQQTRAGVETVFGAGPDGSFGIFNQTASNIQLLQVFNNGSGIGLGVNTKPRIIHGSGFPNGVVSAPIGSIYIDTNITNGVTMWLKKVGASTTGWVPNDLSATVPATATSSGIAGQRAYDAGYLYLCTATNTWRRVALSSW